MSPFRTALSTPRSAREILLIGGGAALCVTRYSMGDDFGNLTVYFAATALFALRFYLARIVAVGACVGAIAQQWPHLRFGLDHASVETLAVFPLLALVLLASRDLVERYDRAPSRFLGLQNPLADFEPERLRTIRWACYAAGALGGLLDHTLQLTWLPEPPLWPRAMMLGLVFSVTLLAVGRAVGLLGVWCIGVAVAFRVGPQVLPAERWIAGEWGELDLLYAGGPHYTLAMFLLAMAAAAISTPDIVRLFRRTVFRDEADAGR